MTHSFLASLFLVCFLFSKASGIRLEKGFPIHSPQKQEDNALTTTSSQSNKEVTCTNGQCKGSNRKLVTTSISSANTKSKRVKNGEHQYEPLLKENGTDDQKHGGGKSSSVSKYGEIIHENYPDLTDIAEMDYSPARRKPPIHN